MITPGTITDEQAHKYTVAFRASLEGAQMTRARDALEDMLRTQTGRRRDRITPEYAHPLRVAMHLFDASGCMRDAEERDALIAAGLLHDIPEDYAHRTVDDITVTYGPLVGQTVNGMTRKRAADPSYALEKTAYYEQMHHARLTLLVKLADRIHNFHSMILVFKEARQHAYLAEARDYLLPAAAAHRKTHPDLRPVNRLLTYSLDMQIALLETVLSSDAPHVLARP